MSRVRILPGPPTRRPAETTVLAAGQRVEWTNDDAFDHTVTGANLAWGSIDNLHPKESFAHTFKEPGVYPYSCILHYGMVGVVVVG